MSGQNNARGSVTTADAGTDDKPSKSDRGPTHATLLVELAGDAELFHDPAGDPFATFAVGEHRETWPTNSKGFRRWLQGRFYREFGKAAGGQALQDALAVIECKALHDGPECPVHVRVAGDDKSIYLDLCNAEWQAIEVTPGGWRIVQSDAVRAKFIRRRGMLPLPTPTTGGSVKDLRRFVNLPDNDGWILFVAWMVAAFRPTGPYPVLTVRGEQGSTKSTLCRVARELIDPNAAPLRRPPRDDRDTMIAACNS